MLAYMTKMGVAGYGEQPSWEVSHGESYLLAVQGRFAGSGLYLLDEAEGPLSFQSTLALLYQLQDLVERAGNGPAVAVLPRPAGGVLQRLRLMAGSAGTASAGAAVPAAGTGGLGRGSLVSRTDALASMKASSD
jgi:hypothetical protein